MNLFGVIIDLTSIILLVGGFIVLLVILLNRKRISRVKGIFGQRVDDLVRTIDPPEKMIDRAYSRKKEAVARLNKAVIDIMATKGRLQKMEETYSGKISGLETEIKSVVKQGNRKKTEHLLKMKKMYEITIAKTKKNITNMEKKLENANEIRIKAEFGLEEFKVQRNILKSRLAVGESINDIQKDAYNIISGKESSRDLVEEVEEKIDSLEVENAVIDELNGSGVFDNGYVNIDVSDEMNRFFPEKE